MTEIPTIKIATSSNDRGYKIINLSQFVAERHQAFEPEAHVPPVAWQGETMVADAGLFEDLTDDELRKYITDRTGRAPHWKSTRETLLAKAMEA
jgi:hypothetical protein